MLEWNSMFNGQIPQQQNSIDCGVFLCLFARHVIFEKQFNFCQSDIGAWRKLIEQEICTLNIMDQNLD